MANAVSTFVSHCHAHSGGFVRQEPSARQFQDSRKPNSRERGDLVVKVPGVSAFVDFFVSDPTRASCANLPGIYTKSLVSLEENTLSLYAYFPLRKMFALYLCFSDT